MFESAQTIVKNVVAYINLVILKTDFFKVVLCQFYVRFLPFAFVYKCPECLFYLPDNAAKLGRILVLVEL